MSDSPREPTLRIPGKQGAGPPSVLFFRFPKGAERREGEQVLVVRALSAQPVSLRTRARHSGAPRGFLSSRGAFANITKAGIHHRPSASPRGTILLSSRLIP